MVIVCAECLKILFYPNSTGRLPCQSLACHDPGTIPARLPNISLIELLVISKNFLSTSVLYRRPISGMVQVRLKGYSYVLQINAVESEAQCFFPVKKSSSEIDFWKFF